MFYSTSSLFFFGGDSQAFCNHAKALYLPFMFLFAAPPPCDVAARVTIVPLLSYGSCFFLVYRSSVFYMCRHCFVHVSSHVCQLVCFFSAFCIDRDLVFHVCRALSCDMRFYISNCFLAQLIFNLPERLINFPFVRIWGAFSDVQWNSHSFSHDTAPQLSVRIVSGETALSKAFLSANTSHLSMLLWHFHFAGTVPYSPYFGSPARSKQSCTIPYPLAAYFPGSQFRDPSIATVLIRSFVNLPPSSSPRALT